jgi:hypothetical protein
VYRHRTLMTRAFTVPSVFHSSLTTIVPHGTILARSQLPVFVFIVHQMEIVAIRARGSCRSNGYLEDLVDCDLLHHGVKLRLHLNVLGLLRRNLLL